MNSRPRRVHRVPVEHRTLQVDWFDDGPAFGPFSGRTNADGQNVVVEAWLRLYRRRRPQWGQKIIPFCEVLSVGRLLLHGDQYR